MSFRKNGTASPTVSIIVINFNTRVLTEQCIRSIYEYTRGIDFEVILVDNGSTECDPGIFLTLFPDVRLIRSATNVGFAKGNNLGISEARGIYYLLVNSDTYLRENSILKCVDYFRSHPDVGALTPKLVFPDGRPQSAANRFPSIHLSLLVLTRAFKLLSPTKKEELFLGEYITGDRPIEVDWICGTFFLTGRDVINRMPGSKLSDKFFMYFEDVEWCLDIRRLGYRVVYWPETEVVHYGSASQDKTEDVSGKSLKKMEQIAENEAIFLRKSRGSVYQKLYSFLSGLVQLSVGNFDYAKIGFRAAWRTRSK